mgnify:CR=1 FL=1
MASLKSRSSHRPAAKPARAGARAPAQAKAAPAKAAPAKAASVKAAKKRAAPARKAPRDARSSRGAGRSARGRQRDRARQPSSRLHQSRSRRGQALLHRAARLLPVAARPHAELPLHPDQRQLRASASCPDAGSARGLAPAARARALLHGRGRRPGTRRSSIAEWSSDRAPRDMRRGASRRHPHGSRGPARCLAQNLGR